MVQGSLAEMAELDSKPTRFHVPHRFPSFAGGEAENINIKAQRSRLMGDRNAYGELATLEDLLSSLPSSPDRKLIASVGK